MVRLTPPLGASGKWAVSLDYGPPESGQDWVSRQVNLLSSALCFCFYWTWSSGVAYFRLAPELTWLPLPTLDSFSELAC